MFTRKTNFIWDQLNKKWKNCFRLPDWCRWGWGSTFCFVYKLDCKKNNHILLHNITFPSCKHTVDQNQQSAEVSQTILTIHIDHAWKLIACSIAQSYHYRFFSSSSTIFYTFLPLSISSDRFGLRFPTYYFFTWRVFRPQFDKKNFLVVPTNFFYPLLQILITILHYFKWLF